MEGYIMNSNDTFKLSLVFESGKTITVEQCVSVENIVEVKPDDSVVKNIHIYFDRSDATFMANIPTLVGEKLVRYSSYIDKYDEVAKSMVSVVDSTVEVDHYAYNRYYERLEKDQYTVYIGFGL